MEAIRESHAAAAGVVKRGRAACECGAHIGLRQVTVERGGVKLSEAVNLVHIAVQAVADRDVDQAVVAPLQTWFMPLSGTSSCSSASSKRQCAIYPSSMLAAERGRPAYQRHCGLRALLCQRIKPSPSAASQNDSHNILRKQRRPR